MNKLNEGQVEQVRIMRKDGKKYSEIRGFFETTYKIKLFDSEIAAIVKEPAEKKPKKSASVRKVIIRGKRALRDLTSETSEEFVEHIHAAFNIHKKGFLSRVQNILESESDQGI